MNFKMRMRKLEIKSIRAASSVRQALINLNALPQSSPVCGLIRVSEVEQLACSYGVEPPQVLYDVFLLQHSDQKQLPNHSRSAAGQVQKLREKSSSGSNNNTPGIVTNLMQSSQGLQMYQGTWENRSPLQQEPDSLGLLFGGTLTPQAGQYVTSNLCHNTCTLYSLPPSCDVRASLIPLLSPAHRCCTAWLRRYHRRAESLVKERHQVHFTLYIQQYLITDTHVVYECVYMSIKIDRLLWN